MLPPELSARRANPRVVINEIRAGDILEELRPQLRRWLRDYRNNLTECLSPPAPSRRRDGPQT